MHAFAIDKVGYFDPLKWLQTLAGTTNHCSILCIWLQPSMESVWSTNSLAMALSLVVQIKISTNFRDSWYTIRVEFHQVMQSRHFGSCSPFSCMVFEYYLNITLLTLPVHRECYVLLNFIVEGVITSNAEFTPSSYVCTMHLNICHDCKISCPWWQSNSLANSFDATRD